MSRPKIVVLDGYALNPGDLSWEPFHELGDLVVYDRTPAEQIVERARSAPIVLTNKTPLGPETLRALDTLRYVGVLATGYNIVDTPTANARDIVVSNVPTYGSDSVAQHTIALVLSLIRPIALHDEAVKRGEWSSSPDWCFARAPIDSLSGKTLGLVGLGRIGIAVGCIAAAMGMDLVGYDVDWPRAEGLDQPSIVALALDELFVRADVVSLHCPLTEDTHHLVDAARLARMKPSALLVNTSRGPLIDGHALAAALQAGTIAGAALDVLEVEPPTADDPLLEAPNCIITPHIAWYAKSARERLLSIAADNLAAFLAGKAVNRVT